jgi:hypothetical protein
MGNTRNTGYLQNAIKVSDAGAISFMSGSTMLATINTTGQMSGSAPVLFAATASFVANAQTASFVALAQSASNAVAAQTASFANAFTVANTLTAQTLVVQTITSSVDFVTGSTRFGSILGNTHVFSGSVTMNPGGLFVSSSGNVGIGTTSLSEKLTVSGSIALVGNYSIKSDFEGVTFLQHNVNDGNFWTWQEQSAGWGYFVGNRNSQLNALGGIMAGSGLGSFLTNNSGNGWSLAPLSGSLSAYATIAFDHNFGKAYFSGSVGIGTTSPTLANLQVNGSGNTTIGFIGASSMTTGQSVFFQVGKNQSAINNAGELSFKYVGDDNASNMVSLGFYGNGQKLNILKNGNVGIGTATPGYSLDISGSQALLRIQSTSAGFGSPSINLLQGAIDTVISATNNGLEIGTWSANDIIFKTTQVERARISTNGLKFQNGPSYLNYYDEGTWTPVFTFDSGSPYTGTTLRYIRIGKLLFLHGQTACDTSGRSGGITITGLPFTLETGTGQGSNDCYLAIWGLNDNCYSYGYPSYSLNSTSLSLYVHGGPSLGSARYFPLTVANCNLSTVYVSFMNTFVCA